MLLGLAGNGASRMLGGRDFWVGMGLHPTGFAATTAWILPNPSGLNKAFTLDALVKAYSELRTALRAAPSPRESIMVTDDTIVRRSRPFDGNPDLRAKERARDP